jgi:plastocyanin
MLKIKNNQKFPTRFFPKIYGFLMITVIFLTLISGCVSVPTGTKSGSPEISGTAPQPQVIVSIKARSFDPATISIKAGTTVTWINEDPMIHRVEHLPEVNHPELFNSGPLSSGQSYSYKFQDNGRFAYGDPQIGGGRSYLVIVE